MEIGQNHLVVIWYMFMPGVAVAVAVVEIIKEVVVEEPTPCLLF